MGFVYEAEDTELSRRVALKVLARAAVADEERRRRFLREARAAAALTHPNLAAVYDAGEIEGTVYLAMELVRGSTLRAAIEAAPAGMPAARVVETAVSIARAIGKAHAVGIVHRDLKPENVMTTEDGTIKIVDFGLAKLLGSTAEGTPRQDLSTEEGRILGTPSYMAPEQAKSTRVGPEADVFAIGVMLYEMLTGVRPFTGATAFDVLVAAARDEPLPPSRRVSHLPKALDAVVMRCLAKAPAERHPNGDALADVLEALDRSKPSASRGRVIAVACVLLAIGGAVAVAATRPTMSTPSGLASATTPATSSAPIAPIETTTSIPSATGAPSSVSSSPPSTSVEPPRPGVARPVASPSASARPAAPRASVDPLANQK